MPFVYENGLPVGYECESEYSPEITAAVEAHMLAWFRSLPGQSRQRLGKVGMIQGSEVNLRRLENE